MTKQFNPEHARVYAEIFCNSPWSASTGLRIVQLEPGYCKGIVQTSQRHHNAVCTVHGGAFASFFDMVLYSAAYPGVDEDWGLTTVDLTTDFLRGQVEGTVIIEGRVTKQGRTLIWTEGMATDEQGHLLATASSKCMAAEKLTPFKDIAAQTNPETPLPPKFL